MAFAEITTFNISSEPCIPFGLSRAPEHNLFAACCRRSVKIIELGYSHHFDGNLNFQQSFVDNPSPLIPSNFLNKDSASIYKSSNAAQRHDLLIDPHLMSDELRIDQSAISMVSARWSPQLERQQYYLACLTNFGGCEIRGVDKPVRRWDVVVCDVAKHWLRHCGIDDAIKTFDELKNAWHRIRLTAISWMTQRLNDDLIFATISSDGRIAFCELNAENELRIAFEWDTKLQETNLLEWITFNGKNDVLKSFMVAGNIHGNVSIFDVNIVKKSRHVCGMGDERKLFSDDDGVRAHGIQWEYCDNTDLLVVCLCKGMHFFVFLLSGEGLLLTQHVHYVGHLMITGIYRLSKLEYVVGTAMGHIECIRINIDDATDSITLTKTVRGNPIYNTNCSLFGLANSTNNAFTLMAQFVNVPFDHLIIREPASVMVCHHMGAECLTHMLANRSLKLTRVYDLAELVRCTQEKHDEVFQEYLSKMLEDICVTDAYLYSLKVRLVVTSGRSTYLRQKYRLKESSQLLGEYEILRKIVFVIWAFRSLSHLGGQREQLTEFQMQAAHGLRAFLRVFLQMDVTNVYESLIKRFRPIVELLLTETEHFDELPPVSCVYCDQPIEVDKLTCADEHDMPRCCLSQVQLPLINRRYCERCQVAVNDDIELLLQVTGEAETERVCCPLCDVEIDVNDLSELII